VLYAIEQRPLIRRLDLETSILRFNIGDIIRNSLYFRAATSANACVDEDVQATDTQLHLVSRDIGIHGVQLQKSFVNSA
jgi:hypothetical protein